MKQLQKLITVFFAAAIMGCATTGKYEKVLQSWVGATEIDLVKQWGPPDSVYTAEDGTRMLTYYSTSLGYFPGSAGIGTGYHNGIYGTGAYGSLPSESRLFQCKTSFSVAKGVITDWLWKGNNCTSK